MSDLTDSAALAAARRAWAELKHAESEIKRLCAYKGKTAGMRDDLHRHYARAEAARQQLAAIMESRA